MTTFIKMIIAISLLSILAGCSGKKDDTLEPKGLTYKSSEVLVRQCQDISDLEFMNLLEKHEVSVKKQMSPHLYIVTWDDGDRSAAQVIQDLKNTTMFCGVDKYLEQK